MDEALALESFEVTGTPGIAVNLGIRDTSAARPVPVQQNKEDTVQLSCDICILWGIA